MRGRPLNSAGAHRQSAPVESHPSSASPTVYARAWRSLDDVARALILAQTAAAHTSVTLATFGRAPDRSQARAVQLEAEEGRHMTALLASAVDTQLKRMEIKISHLDELFSLVSDPARPTHHAHACTLAHTTHGLHVCLGIQPVATASQRALPRVVGAGS